MTRILKTSRTLSCTTFTAWMLNVNDKPHVTMSQVSNCHQPTKE